MKKIIFLALFLLSVSTAKAGEYRIISLAPNTTEILFSLGLGGSIVGVDEYSDYPREARDIKRVGNFNRPNVEKILLLRPEHILVNADLDADLMDYLKARGAKVIKVSPKSVDELYRKMLALGRIFNRENRASFIIEDIKRRIKELPVKRGAGRPKVFVQLFHDPLVTGSSFIGDVVRLAGGNNIAQDIKDDNGLFSPEVLLYRDPDIIVKAGFSKDSDLNPDILLRPGPRIILAIEELHKIFYEQN
ncbi:MAG: ABC transporter substrate-binding protein [Candidatus Omnitrophica bacterium]|nr:ABC transporter substrate-binding protein [Candidatus Omnitrophota bacterium]